MLRDTAWLRDQLHIALALVPLAAAACGDATAQPQPNPQPPPQPPHFPSCPSGDFCAPLAKVKPLAKDATVKLGCPVTLKDHNSATGSGDTLPRFSGASLDEAATTKQQSVKATATDCCYHWVELCPGGRPLLADASQPIVATTRAGAAWGGAAQDAALPAALRAALHAGWLADALAEHASIASFARATLELLAVGAPPALIADTQRASLDEIEHARATFALAARYGAAVEPDALPIAAPRDGGLARVARDVLLEGCIGETIAALHAARAAAACDDAEIAAMLQRIADDEARHAALAWRTLAWATAAHGGGLLDELRALATDVRAVAATELPDAEPDADALARHGRLDARARARVVLDAWREIIAPTLAQLG
jgi:hypothetical protein